MSNIYYIEDLLQHFESLSLLLKDNGFNVFPKDQEWSAELNSFIEFLHDQSSTDKKKKLEEIFLKYKPDLIIIDVDLGVKASGDGEHVYKNFLLKSENWHSTPVIYLTYIGKGNITLYNKTRHVSKVLKKLNELDTDAIKKDLLEKISELIHPPKKGFGDSIIDSI